MVIALGLGLSRWNCHQDWDCPGENCPDGYCSKGVVQLGELSEELSDQGNIYNGYTFKLQIMRSQIFRSALSYKTTNGRQPHVAEETIRRRNDGV